VEFDSTSVCFDLLSSIIEECGLSFITEFISKRINSESSILSLKLYQTKQYAYLVLFIAFVVYVFVTFVVLSVRFL